MDGKRMSEKAEIAVEVLGVSIANKATVAGALTGAVGWVAQVNWIGLAGVLVAVIGLAANVYFQHRRDKREASATAAREARETAESAARIALMQLGINPPPRQDPERQHERA